MTNILLAFGAAVIAVALIIPHFLPSHCATVDITSTGSSASMSVCLSDADIDTIKSNIAAMQATKH